MARSKGFILPVQLVYYRNKIPCSVGAMMLLAGGHLSLQRLDMAFSFLSEPFLASSIANAFLLG